MPTHEQQVKDCDGKTKFVMFNCPLDGSKVPSMKLRRCEVWHSHYARVGFAVESELKGIGVNQRNSCVV